MIKGQWFYRPQEAKKKKGGTWECRDARELFYSFHQDEFPAESVMHKCVVHFIPLHKQFPSRSQHPGFIVQKVYDTTLKRLWWLTDKDYEDDKQKEIELLIQETLSRVGDLPDIETEKPIAVKQDPTKTKKNVSPLDVSSPEEPEGRIDQHLEEIPRTGPSNASEYHAMLSKIGTSTGHSYRDIWIEKLVQAVQHACCPAGDVSKDSGGKFESKVKKDWNKHKDTDVANRSEEKVSKNYL